jgi:hypothetical protein
MKTRLLLPILCLSVSACAPPPPPAPIAATASPVQSGAAQGPIQLTNTTGPFDGTYTNIAIQNISAGNALPSAGEGSASCPNYQVAPPLTITNGLARVQVNNLTFQGYVTPQGGLVLRSGLGQKFEGQIDHQHIVSGRVIGACAYNVSWQRSS